MARGKRLDENLPVIKTDTEEGSIPNILITENFGIEVQDSPVTYSCVEKKLSNKTSEDGKSIIQYYKWTPFPAYCVTLEQAIKRILEKSVAQKLERNTKLEMQAAVDKVVETYRDFSKSLNLSFHEDTIKIMSDIDKRYREMEEKLKGLERLEDELVNNSDKLMELIKEKRRIIVNNTEEKQHRYKLEK